MANTYRDDPLRSAHRADEIGVHQRRADGHGPAWLIPLLAILLVLGLIWAFTRRHRSEPISPAITPTAEQSPLQNAVPDIPKPDVPKPDIPNPDLPKLDAPKAELPDVPKPELPDAPKAELPDMPKPESPDAPKAEPPNAPNPRAAAAIPPAPPDAAADAGALPDAERDTSASSAERDTSASSAGVPGSSVCVETTFYFPTDERSVNREDRVKLRTLAECLKEHPSEIVQLQGRAHPVAGRSDARTEALALHRAQTIENELERLGVRTAQIRVTRSEPFCAEDATACLVRNRSVVVTKAE